MVDILTLADHAGSAGGAIAAHKVLSKTYPAALVLGSESSPALKLAESSRPGFYSQHHSPERLLELHEPRVLLVGPGVPLSEYETWEQATITEAKERGIPVVGTYNRWSDAESVFCHRGHDWRYAPDSLAVVDDVAGKRLGDAGFPGRITATGNPAHDHLADARHQRMNSLEQFRAYESFGVRYGRTVVPFLSQPISLLPTFRGIGYDEYEVIKGFASAMQMLHDYEAEKFTPVVRFHPLEKQDRKFEQKLEYTKHAFHGLEVVIDESKENQLSLMRISPATVSMESMGLVEAALVGSLPVSYQPRLSRQDTLGINESGVSILVKKPHDLFDVLFGVYQQDPEFVRERAPNFASYGTDGKATDRVAALVQEYLA